MIKQDRVTFYVNCWQRDWKTITQRSYWSEKFANLDYRFKNTWLLINDVDNRDEVAAGAKKLLDDNVISNLYFVEDYAEEAMDVFGISRESFFLNGIDGYCYAIPHLVATYLCDTDYILTLMGDVMMVKDGGENKDWITKGVALLDEHDDICTVSPLFEKNLYGTPYLFDSVTEFENWGEWFVGYGFSDNCYLNRASNFKGQIYNKPHTADERYTGYGGNCFERRVDNYMRWEGKKRAIYRYAATEHKINKEHVRKKGVIYFAKMVANKLHI